MHREIRHHRDGFVIVGADETEQGQLGIGRAGGPHDIGIFIAGMHVGAHGVDAERIRDHFVRTPDPAAAIREGMGIDLSPSGFGGHESGVSLDDGLGDLRNHLRGVGLIFSCPETQRHRAGSRVGVRSGDENMIGGQGNLFRDQRLDRLTDICGQHAGIDNTECDCRFTRFQDESPGMEGIIDAVGNRLKKAAVADRGELLRGDVDRSGPGFEGVGGARDRRNGKGEAEGETG